MIVWLWHKRQKSPALTQLTSIPVSIGPWEVGPSMPLKPGNKHIYQCFGNLFMKHPSVIHIFTYTYHQLPIWSISTGAQCHQDMLHPTLCWMQDLASCLPFPASHMLQFSSGLQRICRKDLQCVCRQLCRCASLRSLCICRLSPSTSKRRQYCHSILKMAFCEWQVVVCH